MIWSVIPEDIIFAEQSDYEELRQVEYMGKLVTVRRLSPGRGEIISLLSTDPSDFLVKSLHPGSVIDLL